VPVFAINETDLRKLFQKLKERKAPGPDELTSSSYVRLLFIDYSSAFNTNLPAKLHHKLINTLRFPPTICDWLLDFSLDREQYVKVGNMKSSSLKISTGTPQGCVLSPTLYSLFTFDCGAIDDKNMVIKFADDTTICGFIKNGDECSYRAQIDHTIDWCSQNNLTLNVSKTKEIVIDFRKRRNTKLPIKIDNKDVEIVNDFKLLGTHITHDLKWHHNILDIMKKSRQRLYFLRCLKSFHVHPNILMNFYRAIVEAVLTRSITIWFGSATKRDLNRLSAVIRSAEKITGMELPSLEKIFHQRTQKRTAAIMKDPSHPANRLFVFLRSQRQLKTYFGNKQFVNSFYPAAVKLFNS